MITVSVRQLVDAIEEADAFKLPEMSAGEEYIYNDLYKRLSYGENVKLSEIDYNRFELDDIDSIRDIYFNILEANENKADRITYTLHEISPTVAAATFV